MRSRPHPFPFLRWLAVAWLAVYLPSYTVTYGVLNFLFICNIGVILTAVALIFGNRLVLSSQALAAPIIGLGWITDAGWRLVTGDFLYGGTAYMWDPQFPILTRLLSLYHVFWPVLVVACVARVGYDRRAWLLQVGIAAAAMLAARVVTPPELNVNFAYRDPLFGIELGPGLIHIAAMLAVLAVVVYGLMHWILNRAYGDSRPKRNDNRRGSLPSENVTTKRLS